jgi:hypothetical protein
MSARLEALLLEEEVLPPATIRAAVARQRVYGGSLDTALLELEALTEAQVWARLASVTGLPVPAPHLVDGTSPPEPPPLPAGPTGQMRFVPVGARDQRLNLLCAEPVAVEEIKGVASAYGFDAKLYVVPELRLMALRQRVYGEPLPQRYAPLLARAMGAERARKAFAPPRRKKTAPAPPLASALPTIPMLGSGPQQASPDGVPEPPTPLGRVIDESAPLLDESVLETEMEVGDPDDLTGERSVRIATQMEILASYPADPSDGVPQVEPQDMTPAELIAYSAAATLCRRAGDPTDKGRPLALRVLRQRMGHPVAQAFVAELRAKAAADTAQAADAIDSLAEMRDEASIPVFIARLTGEAAGAQAARRALLRLTALHFEYDDEWAAWWEANSRRSRAAWLLDALGGKDLATRMLAFEELRLLCENSFGYGPELPKRKREAARRRWLAWWQARGALAGEA